MSRRFFGNGMVFVAIMWSHYGCCGSTSGFFFVIRNSSSFLCFAFMLFESFRLMRGLRSTKIGGGSNIFSILISLAFGGVINWHGDVFLWREVEVVMCLLWDYYGHKK